jgi:hypothetical protein
MYLKRETQSLPGGRNGYPHQDKKNL